MSLFIIWLCILVDKQIADYEMHRYHYNNIAIPDNALEWLIILVMNP